MRLNRWGEPGLVSTSSRCPGVHGVQWGPEGPEPPAPPSISKMEGRGGRQASRHYVLPFPGVRWAQGGAEHSPPPTQRHRGGVSWYQFSPGRFTGAKQGAEPAPYPPAVRRGASVPTFLGGFSGAHRKTEHTHPSALVLPLNRGLLTAKQD